MSASFPAPISGPFNSASPMYPNQGYNYALDPYAQGYNSAPGSSFPPPTANPQTTQQGMMKTLNYDPRQANGYSFPPNGGQQMLSPGMGPGYPPQSMRAQQNYYAQQQAMGQMPPATMQKPPASAASTTPMGPPNGMQQMMMQTPAMSQMQSSATGQAAPISQMKSPMPGPPMTMRQQQPSVSQMNSPGMFTAPAPPRMKQQMSSPGNMHMMSCNHAMGGDPSASSANHQPPQNQMNSAAQQQQQSVQAPPSQETPFTAVTHYEMPPAFPQFQDEFKKHNPTTAYYYDRRRSQLKVNYPSGQVQAPAQEPATFGFLPGQAHYEEKFDRRNAASQSSMPSNQMSSAPLTSAQMLQRQMSAPGIPSPSYAQQQVMAPPTGPAAKKTKRSASTTVEPTPPAYQQNRMMNMGTFNNPNLKSPGMMPMTGQMGSMPPPQIPPSSGAGSNGMSMMSNMSSMGSNGNAIQPGSMPMDQMSQNGMNPHMMGSGMPMSSMPSNSPYSTPHDIRPPPQYSQMQMPSSSQVYSNQMQLRYGNGLVSPGHHQTAPSNMQQSSWNTANPSAANVYAPPSSMQQMQYNDSSRFSM